MDEFTIAEARTHIGETVRIKAAHSNIPVGTTGTVTGAEESGQGDGIGHVVVVVLFNPANIRTNPHDTHYSLREVGEQEFTKREWRLMIEVMSPAPRAGGIQNTYAQHFRHLLP